MFRAERFAKVINVILTMPFMVTENILMYCVSKGGDRQELHEAIRRHSVETAKEIKENGKPNDLFYKILSDPLFDLTKEELESIADPSKLTGRANEQTGEFLHDTVLPVLERNKSLLGIKAEVNI